MAYLGQGPFQEFTNPPTKDSFTGDGSTTTFDMANAVPSGHQNALEVYIDNVRQEPGTGKAFTLGVDGSNDNKRITFASAPANGASIYVINDKTNTSVTAPLQNDLNGTELILDGDGDTSITADTDDRIDFKIAGTDHFHITSSSSDTVFQNKVDAKDFLFNQYDGRTILEVNDAGYVALANGATGSGELRIYEDTDNGTNYSGFKVGTQSADIDYVLPTADGSSGQHLTTNGSGTLSWAAAVAANPSSADGDSLGTTSLEWSDLYLADGGVIYLGADQDTTLTHVADTGILLNSTRQLQFGDSGTYIHQSADGVLDLVSDTEIEINATTIDINGAVQISGTTTIAGNLIFGSATVTEAQLEVLDGATVTTTELNIMDGDTSASATTVADADRVVFNDGGTMKQVAVTDLAAYFDDEITAMPNLVTTAATTVGALDSGSITSGFGNIDNGASNITSGGLVKLDVDADADDVSGDSATGRLTLGAGEDLNLYHGGTNSYIVNDTGDLIIKTGASDEDFIIKGNDGGSEITALTLDMSAAGAAAFNSTVTATGFIIGSANIAESELEMIDGITAGTVAASKALVADANIDITGGRNITISGELDAATLDISGDADIDGTLEADAITIAGVTLAETIADTVGAMVTSNTETGITVAYQDADNTLDFTIGTLNQDTTGTAAVATTVTITDNESTNETNAIIFTAGGDVDGGNLGLESDGDLTYNPSTGLLTTTKLDADGGITVDNITIDGTEIDLSSGNLTIDVAGDLNLDVDGADINLLDAGTQFGALKQDSNNFVIKSTISDADLLIQGTDGGSGITALTLDMSSAGQATFNDSVFSGTGLYGLNADDHIQMVNDTRIDFTINGNNEFRFEADGDFHADADVIAYSTTVSDERLKENIQPIEDALSKVSQLNGVTFTYKADGKESAGLIAQDVEKVLPSAISEKQLPLKMDDGVEYKVLQYDQTIGLLVEAIKELTAKVEELENK